MRILKLSNSVVTPATAVKYTNPKTKITYYNLNHGKKGYNTWKWSCGLDSKTFTPTEDTLTLNQTDLNLSVVHKSGEKIKDLRGNSLYNVTRDDDPTHVADIILLWSVVANGCTNIEYSTSGDLLEIGLGSYGTRRGDVVYIYPAPVLEIYGDCVLKWSGVDKQGAVLRQTIQYTQLTDKWTFQGIVKTGGTDAL